MVSDGTKGPVAVTGVKAADYNNPPARLELRTLRKNKEQWNLFLLGMERFTQNTNEDDPLSYYRICGIHGMPYTKWPEKDWYNEKPINPNNGYCTHSSALFLTWHRPYMALFEQILYKHVNDIAQSFAPNENRAAYVKAAQTFRFPYWDWALQVKGDITLFPREITAETKHNVIRPGSGGVETTMNINPLASYKFGKRGQEYVTVRKDKKGQEHRLVIDRFPRIHATIRQPDSTGTRSDPTLVEAGLKEFTTTEQPSTNQPLEKGKNLAERVYLILTGYEKYGSMCCNLFPTHDTWNGWGSLEDIHNAVHDYVGGDGHMGDPAVAAFDPVFWLHHQNIDRLLAIWQALHDDPKAQSTYVQPSIKSEPTRIYRLGAGDAETPLIPFSATETLGDWWTSNKVKDTKVLGYVYPETQLKSKDQIRAKLHDLYRYSSLPAMATQPNTSSTQVFQARAAAHLAQTAPPLEQVQFMSLASTQLQQAPAPEQVPLKSVKSDQPHAAPVQPDSVSTGLPHGRSVADLVVNNKYLEWLVNIKAEKHANGGNFVVHVFLGTPDDTNSRTYIAQHNHVASFSTFGSRVTTGCSKCQDDQDARMQVTGQIPLTIGLVERYMSGQLDALTVEAVEPFLARELHWRVTTNGGELIDRAAIPGLLIGVVTDEVTLPTDGISAPIYDPNVVPRPNCTTREGSSEGRGGGTGYNGTTVLSGQA